MKDEDDFVEMEDYDQESDLEKELFGATSQSDFESGREEDRNIYIEKRKNSPNDTQKPKNPKPKPKNTMPKAKIEKADDSSGVSHDRILEARKDFEDAMGKVFRRKRPNASDGGIDLSEMDDVAIKLREAMLKASHTDDRAALQNRPAVAKLRLLPHVQDLFFRYET